MPTISVNRKDFDKLLGRHVTDKELEAWLPLVKGEIKEVDAASGEIRFELQDSNRPDLWCVEGIARQIRVKLNGRPDSYPYLRTAKRRLDQILVEQGLERVRPFIGGCKVRGYKVAEEGLAQLIQTQEKLADIFGRKRRMVSIGLYRLPSIKFPVTYVLADPDRTRFRPLGYGEPMSLREILEIHPKGQEYGGLLAGHDQVPLLRDAKGDVLSFPPIINSRDIGEVQVGDADLFIEVTGTDLRMVMLAVNILAANLHEIVSNVLGAHVDLIHRMRLSNGHPEARCVEIENVMSQSYECLRQWVLPSLLRVETASSRSFYPHFLFELGEVVVLDPQTETGTRTEVRLGALLAHANANFSETHSFLDLLCFYLGWAYALTPTDHPSFLEGRVGRVEREGNAVGLIGELHPEVLERWQITMPCSAFELVIDLPGKSQS